MPKFFVFMLILSFFKCFNAVISSPLSWCQKSSMCFSLWMKPSFSSSGLCSAAVTACGLPPAPCSHHIDKSREFGGRSSAAVPPRCKSLMLLLLFSLRSFQQPAASSSDALSCVDFSVYLMTEGKSDFHQSCCKSPVCALLGDTCLRSEPPCFSHLLLDWVQKWNNVHFCACMFSLSVSLVKHPINQWCVWIALESVTFKIQRSDLKHKNNHGTASFMDAELKYGVVSAESRPQDTSWALTNHLRSVFTKSNLMSSGLTW